MVSAMRTRHNLFSAVVALALTLCGPGCDFFSDSTSPTTTQTETFSGTLEPQKSSVFTFTVSKSGPVSITLTNVVSTSTTVLGLGIGTPNGAACTLTSSTQSATPGSTAQIVVTENAGTYCVRVFDVGTLPASVTFTITVAHS
jgi:hypothetical protein